MIGVALCSTDNRAAQEGDTMQVSGGAQDGRSGCVESAEIFYSYKPSLLGPAVEFRLGEHALEWRKGRRAGRAPYRDIRRVRLSFRPLTMQTYRFIAEIWCPGHPRLELASTSWRSMMEQERQDAAYTTFMREMHRCLAATGAQASFESGTSPFVYWPGLLVFAAVALALAVLTVRALEMAAWAAAVFVAGFFALFLWTAGTYFRSTGRANIIRMRCRQMCCRRVDAQQKENSGSAPHHQHRALGVAHDMAGVRAEEVRLHRRPMRAHDDQVALHCLRLFENLVINAALADDRRDMRRIEPAFVGNDRQRFLRGLTLLHVEIRRNVLGQHH